MAKIKQDLQTVRKPIFDYFEGVNIGVSNNMMKHGEFSYAINARPDTLFSISKRAGTRRLGDNITATANYDLFFFDNDTATSTGFYRISTISGTTSIYHLNTSAAWTALTSLGTKIYELGDSTTQFDITNPSGTTFRYTYDTTGTDPNVDHHIRINSSVVINAQNFSAGNNGTFTVTGVSTNYFEVTNASGAVESNKTIGTGSITVTGGNFSHAVAENCCFLVNGLNGNMYLDSTGTAVTDDTTATGHLYNSPRAYKVNAYKSKLYLGDYIDSAGTRHKTSVIRSSVPLGIVSLVDGDHTQPITSLKVTDLKYIFSSDSLDVYRGGTKIGTITVTAKNAATSTLTISSFGTNILSSDELWVANTYTGNKVFRWAEASSGIDVQQYDTFPSVVSGNDAITMMTNIGGVQVFANNNNITVWNDSSLQPLDIGIGCVSSRGYVKNGKLFFIHYSGIYSFDGASMPLNVSAKVQPYISGASKSVLESSCAGKKGLNVFFALSSTTLYYPDGSVKKTVSNVVLELNLQSNNWMIHENLKATQFATYQSDTDADRLEFASTETGYQIMELFTGQLDDRVTSNKEIAFRIDSSDIQLCPNFENFAYPMQLVVECERGSGIEGFVSLDGGRFFQIKGDAVKGCVILKINNKDEEAGAPPRCRRIKVSLRDNTTKLCRISKVALIYKISAEEEERHQINYEN